MRSAVTPSLKSSGTQVFKEFSGCSREALRVFTLKVMREDFSAVSVSETVLMEMDSENWTEQCSNTKSSEK